MREVSVNVITNAVERICIKAASVLSDNMVDLLTIARDREESPFGMYVMDQIVDNSELAAREMVPLCQDTGTAFFFVEVGQGLIITGGDVTAAINEGVRRGYTNAYLRKSIVDDPIFNRVNTKDNTPAVIHYQIVPGDKMRITLLPKGGGAENTSAVKMLRPADGLEGVKKFIIDTIIEAGGKACPPLIVGVGVGGTMDKATWLAKKALARKPGSYNANPLYANLEDEMLDRINASGIGPQGLGGVTTALAVHIEYFPTHIASLPVAVNLNCHSARAAEVII